MTQITAAELIAAAKIKVAQDAERMVRRPAGVPRGAWRSENPISPAHWIVKDLAFKTQPLRDIVFDVNGNVYDAWVWGEKKLVERIDLRAADADARLSRYVRAAA